MSKQQKYPICPSCGDEMTDPEATGHCKGCEQDVHDGCLADWNLCKGCAGETEEE